MITAKSDPHLRDAPAILESIRRDQGRQRHKPATAGIERRWGVDYQRCLHDRFCDVIELPPSEYISRTENSWLIVGDHRTELSAHVRLIIERHGLGIGLLVLHQQQLLAGHILASPACDPATLPFSVPTKSLKGTHGECVLSIPNRKYRADYKTLAALRVAKPRACWDPSQLVMHPPEDRPCAYCSCHELYPSEVTVDIEGAAFGLSRDYRLGFTYAPFGNPSSVVHFLAWDDAPEPLNMNRVPMTVSDLVKLTREINVSIQSFFAPLGVSDYPILDGLANGWAGNSVYHQHFQFFMPESTPAVRQAPALSPGHVLRDDVEVVRLDWPTPVYRVRAADSINTGLVGNDMGGIWRLLGGSRRAPYKSFPAGHVPGARELVPAHTQNILIPGSERGRTAYFFLRDRSRVDYAPDGCGSDMHAFTKLNVGTLEVAGTVIMDDEPTFARMSQWSPETLTGRIREMIAAMSPDENKVAEFESALQELFPT